MVHLAIYFPLLFVIGLLRSIDAHGDNHGTKRCGTPAMTKEERVKAANDFQEWATMKASLKADGTTGAAASVLDWSTPGTVVTIPTYFHVIHNGTTGKQFTYASDPAYIQNQIKALNVGYRGEESMYPSHPNGRSYDRYSVSSADTKIQFCLAGPPTATDNASWYEDFAGDDELAMKTALKKGGLETLNVYVSALGPKLLGWSYLPNSVEEVYDGVVIHNDSMPTGGEGENPSSQGDTLTHEVGHWLNLEHTFEDGCSGPGDYMDLAPPSADYTSTAAKEKVASYGCPVNLDDCTNDSGKKNPIHSFMSYVQVSLHLTTLHGRFASNQ